MTIVEFDTKIDEYGNIHVPAEVAAKLGYGKPIRVSIALTELTSDDKAWEAILRFVDERSPQLVDVEPYVWQREDAYHHLDEKYDTHSAD